jgi:hypothetical protein
MAEIMAGLNFGSHKAARAMLAKLKQPQKRAKS